MHCKSFILFKFVFLFSFNVFLGLRVEWAEENQKLGHVISVPRELYVQGCVRDVDEGLAVCFPVEERDWKSATFCS